MILDVQYMLFYIIAWSISTTRQHGKAIPITYIYKPKPRNERARMDVHMHKFTILVATTATIDDDNDGVLSISGLVYTRFCTATLHILDDDVLQ